ncbi:MAG: substrate-binding domain-containing protein [Pseudomonadota bacterium]
MNLKELAAHLGLSQTTVSRALNGYPEVAEATRKRVADAAEQHNYRPNTRAKGLATGRAMAVGHVIPTSTRHEMVNPIFGDFISGAGETYARNGYDMVLSMVEDGDQARVYRELKAKGTVDGLILHGPATAEPRIGLLRELGLPFCVHGRSTDERAPYSWVDVNNKSAFERATELLADLGHRRIALLNGLEAMDFARRRRAGFEAAMSARALPTLAELMRSQEMTETYGFESASEMLALPDPPTAFLVSSMIVAIGVRRAVEELGLSLGTDVSVITHDDDLSYLRNGGEVPLFTATRSSVREAGRIAAQLLLDQIASPGGPLRTRLLEAPLVHGTSTGPAPRATAGAKAAE